MGKTYPHLESLENEELKERLNPADGIGLIIKKSNLLTQARLNPFSKFKKPIIMN